MKGEGRGVLEDVAGEKTEEEETGRTREEEEREHLSNASSASVTEFVQKVK